MGKDSDFEEALIAAVELHPVLYDLKNHQYKNVKAKEAVWIQIGKELDRLAKECESTWKSLKSQFLAYLRKCNKPTGSGLGKLPYFRHSDVMHFVKDTSSNDNESQFTNSMYNSSISADLDEDLLQLNEEIDLGLVPPAAAKDTIESSGIGQRHRVHKKAIMKRKLDPFEEELLKAVNQDQSDDEFDLFGKMMAKKLRKMDATNPTAAAELQIEFQQKMLERSISERINIIA